MIDQLNKLLGREHGGDDLNRALRDHVRRLHAPVVGALQVTCSDEAEWECIDSFQRCFARELLPALRFAQRAVFRVCNLGGRYEWGALSIAERHFATAESREAFKVMMVKINAHVGVEGVGPAARYGQMQRYGEASSACGALGALLAGHEKLFAADLREAFTADGRDRLKPLLDPAQVAPERRSLAAAIVSARAQARRVELEIQRHDPHTPTLYLVVSCVSLNRADRNSELLCGVHVADRRGGAATVEYVGLGDDPAAYELHDEFGQLRVSDGQLPM